VTPARWARIKEVFGAASERPEAERAAFLDEACAADESLRREVEALLAHNVEDGSTFVGVAGDVAMARLAVGQRVSHYEIQGKIGEGGMGAVYRAYDSQLRRPVALKVLPPEYAWDPKRRERLLREARAASALNHPNIVGIHEVGSDNGVDFIVMEFVDGKTLQQAIPAEGLPLGKVLDYSVQIAGALAKAHAAGVVHRDLKPGNIMVTGDGLVKLLDFGLSRKVQLDAERDTTLTVEGRIMGTPAYMSPEQAQGKAVDTRTDLWSLGVVIYEMVAGRRAFAGSNLTATLFAIVHGEPPTLSDDVPPLLRQIVGRALAKTPEDRYQSAVEMIRDLKQVAAPRVQESGHTMTVGESSVAVSPERPKGRRPVWLYPAVAAFLLFFALNFVPEFYGPDEPGWVVESQPPRYFAGLLCECGDPRDSEGTGQPARYSIVATTPGTPAARAGILPGDVLLDWDGIPFIHSMAWFLWQTGPGTTHRLGIERGGVRRSIPITFGYRSWRVHFANAQAVAHLVTLLSALLSLAIGLFIVWARPRDWVALGFAWALVYAAIAPLEAAGVDYLWHRLPEAVLLLPRLALYGSSAGLMPSFLASMMNFPRPLAVRRWRLALLYLPSVAIFPFFAYPLWARSHNPMALGPSPLFFSIQGSLTGAYLIAALGAMVWNYRRLKDVNERRRLRLVMVGFAAGIMAFLPGIVIGTTPLAFVIGSAYYGSPLPVMFSLLQVALPITVGYAILRHRIFDIRVIVRQGLQYAAARGLLLSLTPLFGLALAADLLLHGDQPLLQVLATRGWWYVALALAAFLAHRRQVTWLGALDRRFFRERYDAQRLLTAVVDEIRWASDFRQAAPRVISQIDAALHPEFALLLGRRPGETAFTAVAGAAGQLGATFPATGKLMALMRVLGKPVDCSETTGGWHKGLPPEETGFLRRARIEWIYPIAIAEGKQEAILALGPRRSEEPYSSEDQQLLESVCGALSVLLERSSAA
jgi:predicted Ser/Thr protein kinase